MTWKDSKLKTKYNKIEEKEEKNASTKKENEKIRKNLY